MSQWYYVDRNGQRQGPVEAVELVALLRTGSAGLDSLVWREGESSWRPLGDFRADLELGTTDRTLPPPLPEVVGARLPHTAAPPPRSGMSGCLIALIVAAVLLVPGTAILAAIALPAYQDYVLRSKITSAVAAATPLKDAVVAHLDQHGRCPADEDLPTSATEGLAQAHIADAAVGEFESNLCGIELRIGDSGNTRIDGKALWLEWEPEQRDWQCSSEIEDRHLPTNCRG